MTRHTPPTKGFMAGALALAVVLEGAPAGVALAQDNTGADRPTTAPATAPATESNGAKANGVYPAPTQGVEQGVPANKDAQATRTTHSSKHKPHHAKQPVKGAAKETTNGAANASAASDARE